MDELFTSIISILNDKDINYRGLKFAIYEIRRSYSKREINTIDASLVDYDVTLYQCAYIYLYLSSHVNIVHELLSEFVKIDLVKNFFQKHFSSIRVCSIGGGPGSDIFGLNSFLNGDCKITGNILDLSPSWKYTFDAVITKLKAFNLRVNYEMFDFLSTNCPSSIIDTIFSADIITIVKFISAVAYDRENAEIKLKCLLQNVKPSAIVLFIDNSGGGYLELMNRAATGANLQKISQIVKHNYHVSLKMSLAMELYDRYNLCPQKTAHISASIWCKREILDSNSQKNPVDFNYCNFIEVDPEDDRYLACCNFIEDDPGDYRYLEHCNFIEDDSGNDKDLACCNFIEDDLGDDRYLDHSNFIEDDPADCKYFYHSNFIEDDPGDNRYLDHSNFIEDNPGQDRYLDYFDFI